jgi:hypothetical protein
MLELGYRDYEFFIFCIGAKTHHPLDTSSVIPTPVEEYHLLGDG